jgi:hypothetical protein
MRLRLTRDTTVGTLRVRVRGDGLSASANDGDWLGDSKSVVAQCADGQDTIYLDRTLPDEADREVDEALTFSIGSSASYTIGAAGSAVVLWRDDDAANFLAPGASGGLAAALGLANNGPVTGEGGLRLTDGLAAWKSTDLLSEGYGSSWGLFRTYSGTQSLQTPGWFRNNVHVSTLPYLYQDVNNSSVLAALSGTDTQMFDYGSGSFTARYYQSGTLSLCN